MIVSSTACGMLAVMPMSAQYVLGLESAASTLDAQVVPRTLLEVESVV